MGAGQTPPPARLSVPIVPSGLSRVSEVRLLPVEDDKPKRFFFSTKNFVTYPVTCLHVTTLNKQNKTEKAHPSPEGGSLTGHLSSLTTGAPLLSGSTPGLRAQRSSLCLGPLFETPSGGVGRAERPTVLSSIERGGLLAFPASQVPWQVRWWEADAERSRAPAGWRATPRPLAGHVQGHASSAWPGTPEPGVPAGAGARPSWAAAHPRGERQPRSVDFSRGEQATGHRSPEPAGPVPSGRHTQTQQQARRASEWTRFALPDTSFFFVLFFKIFL